MEYYSEQSQNTPPGKIIIVPNLFLVFSVICAIISCICGCFILSSIFFGALSILFAILSKGHKQQMIPAARSCVILSVIAMVFSTVTTTVSVYQVFSDPEMYQEFNTQYESLTGISFEEELNALKELYGIN
ncbi:MAG: hypothetical protein IIX48_09755 [Lachnospiraceae bacterium]|nr:hypothetical protein [Lachnospiraceae bacterium]